MEVYYSIFYLLFHTTLAWKSNHLQFSFRYIFIRLLLLIGDLGLLYLISFGYYLDQINKYPIILSFSILLYYILRHIMRSQYQYQYWVHLYHPETKLYYFGHYYSGILYHISDIILKGLIIYLELDIHKILGFFFLITLSLLDSWFYYKGVSDQTGEIFHSLVGFLFHIIHAKNE